MPVISELDCPVTWSSGFSVPFGMPNQSGSGAAAAISSTRAIMRSIRPRAHRPATK